MSQTINRHDFLKLTITFATISAATAVGCGDDDDGPVGGKGGTDSSGGMGGDSDTGGSGGTGGTGGKGGTGGTGGKGGTGGTGGKGGTGGSGGDGGNGEGGGGDGGLGGGGAGGEGGGGEGGLGGGGAGGEGGAPVVAAQCDGGVLAQTSTTAGAAHDHVTAQVHIDLTNFINGANPTAPFALPNTGHSHDISLTAGQIATLRGGGMVTGIVSTSVGAHTHTYTITCS